MSKLDALMARGTDFLGSRVAIMAGAMSWISERHLVSAMSNAGGFGVIAGGAMPPEILSAEIAATKAMTNKPFGVNLITMHPQLNDLIAICAQHQVSHVVLVLLKHVLMLKLHGTDLEMKTYLIFLIAIFQQMIHD